MYYLTMVILFTIVISLQYVISKITTTLEFRRSTAMKLNSGITEFMANNRDKVGMDVEVNRILSIVVATKDIVEFSIYEAIANIRRIFLLQMGVAVSMTVITILYIITNL